MPLHLSFVTDKDYEFSVDPDIITLVEYDPFHGYESETVVAHLTKLNDIATLFAHEEKFRYYYILKLFPFSLKGDAKLWFNSLDPGCVRSPQDMIYYFSAKYISWGLRTQPRSRELNQVLASPFNENGNNSDTSRH